MRARAQRGPRNILGEDGHKAWKASNISINEKYLLQQQLYEEEITAYASETLLGQFALESRAKVPQASDNVTQMPPRSPASASTAAQLGHGVTLTASVDKPFAFRLQSLRTESSQQQLPHQVSSARPTITLWSNDLHIAPLGDLKDLFGRIYPGNGMKWFDHSFSVYCVYSNTCVKSEKVKSVLNWNNLFEDVVRPKNNWMIELTINQFHQTFRDDPDIQQVDAFVCSHFIYMCRLFVPFSKPIIADIAWTNDWMMAHPDWQNIFDNKYNVVVVNNGHLRSRSRAWTGGLPLKLVPNLCLYTKGKYVSSPDAPQKPFLVMRKPWPEQLYSAQKFTDFAERAGLSMSFVQYPKGIKWKSIAENFRAVVHCPYINSLMVFYETYNMNVPIAMPSMALAMANGNAYGFGLYSTGMSGAAAFHAIDYYSGDYPHLIYWDSTASLITILAKFTAHDYRLVSEAMAQRTAAVLKVTQSFWEKQLNCILSIRIPGLSCPNWVPRNAGLSS